MHIYVEKWNLSVFFDFVSKLYVLVVTVQDLKYIVDLIFLYERYCIIYIPENERIEIKTNLLNACRNYTEIKVPYRYQGVVKNLSRNEAICILKQDKGRGVIITNRIDYVEKCEQLLISKQFVQLENDPTEKFEGQVQRTLLEFNH